MKRARLVPPFCTAAVLHDDLEHDPPYLVVEFVDGPSLAEVVRENGPLSPSRRTPWPPRWSRPTRRASCPVT
ncbi:hypothetical protein [Actinoplanes philippinensis]|uniref:hypothetical protein n=1 Tax=Actinoplanes philippinensis TaxID=35752 RepID=UPI0033DEA617